MIKVSDNDALFRSAGMTSAQCAARASVAKKRGQEKAAALWRRAAQLHRAIEHDAFETRITNEVKMEVNVEALTAQGHTPAPETIDSLLAKVPEGYEVLLRSDKEKGWFANVHEVDGDSGGRMVPGMTKSTVPYFSFYAPTALGAVKRAMEVAVTYAEAKLAETAEQKKPTRLIACDAETADKVDAFLLSIKKV